MTGFGLVAGRKVNGKTINEAGEPQKRKIHGLRAAKTNHSSQPTGGNNVSGVD